MRSGINGREEGLLKIGRKNREKALSWRLRIRSLTQLADLVRG